MKPARTTWPAPLSALSALAVAASACLPTQLAQAALMDRGGGLVYDSQRDLTWLADPALLPGPMPHQAAALWASAFEYASGSNWLLPHSAFIDAGCAGAEGFGCVDSDMGQLFHQQLGGQPGTSVLDSSGDTAEAIANVALMPALEPAWFWSWQVADDGASTAFAFHFGNGLQQIRDRDLMGHLLLVHSGDLGAPAPLSSPPTLTLLLLAAAALALVHTSRRRQR